MINEIPDGHYACPTCGAAVREFSYDSAPPLLTADGGDLVKVTTGWRYEPCGHPIGDGRLVLARQPMNDGARTETPPT